MRSFEAGGQVNGHVEAAARICSHPPRSVSFVVLFRGPERNMAPMRDIKLINRYFVCLTLAESLAREANVILVELVRSPDSSRRAAQVPLHFRQLRL